MYQINVKDRDKLINFLVKKNIDAKVHYPIPIHLQKAAKSLKYKKGDFPVAERMANTSVSLPDPPSRISSPRQPSKISLP